MHGKNAKKTSALKHDRHNWRGTNNGGGGGGSAGSSTRRPPVSITLVRCYLKHIYRVRVVTKFAKNNT